MRFLVAAVALLAASCSGGPTPSPAPHITPPGPFHLTVMTHDSFAVSDEVLKEFEDTYTVTVNVLNSGDAGSMVNQAILAKNAPLADVLYGVDNTFLSRALQAGIFEPYESVALADIPQAFQLDGTQHRVTPVDYGDVCLNYDTTAFSADLPLPGTIDELVNPRYRGKLVVENPATSSPGLAFVLATYARFQASANGWHDYWAALRANDVLVSDGWEDAYYNQFSGGTSAGDRPLVVSYATSPAAEVVFAETPPATPPTANIADGCFRQVEFAGVLANGRPEARVLAQKWIDFMLSKGFQEDMPLNMFVLPVEPDATVPTVFNETGANVGNPITMPPDQIDSLRDQLIGEWTDVVLH